MNKNHPALEISPDDKSIERLVPNLIAEYDATGAETLKLHLARYDFASKFVSEGDRVLDIACGVGYGTNLMSKIVPKADYTGVDISSSAIDYAKKMYSNSNINFHCQDAVSYRPENLFDCIVSLETIEHLPKPEEFISHIYEFLRPGGLLIGSVPITPSVDANPYHLHDFTEASYKKIFKKMGMSEIDSLRQVQGFNPIKILLKKEKRVSDLRSNLIKYYINNPKSFLSRVYSTFRYGFSNIYLTSVWQKN